MTGSHFLLLYYDVEKCMVEHTLDFHIHFETVFEIVGLPVLNLHLILALFTMIDEAIQRCSTVSSSSTSALQT